MSAGKTYFFFAAIAQNNGVDSTPKIRMDCGRVTGFELVEHIKCCLDDSLVICDTSGAKHHRFELLLDVAIVVAKLPAQFVRLSWVR